MGRYSVENKSRRITIPDIYIDESWFGFGGIVAIEP